MPAPSNHEPDPISPELALVDPALRSRLLAAPGPPLAASPETHPVSVRAPLLEASVPSTPEKRRARRPDWMRFALMGTVAVATISMIAAPGWTRNGATTQSSGDKAKRSSVTAGAP